MKSARPGKSLTFSAEGVSFLDEATYIYIYPPRQGVSVQVGRVPRVLIREDTDVVITHNPPRSVPDSRTSTVLVNSQDMPAFSEPLRGHDRGATTHIGQSLGTSRGSPGETPSHVADIRSNRSVTTERPLGRSEPGSWIHRIAVSEKRTKANHARHCVSTASRPGQHTLSAYAGCPHFNPKRRQSG